MHGDNGKEHGNYDLGLLYYPRRMENQMQKKMENEMVTGGI